MTHNPYSDREVLEIFVETADDLQSSDFIKQIKNGVTSKQLFRQGVVIYECSGPEREALKAFLLTLRFFRQDNEETSLRNMALRVANLNIDQALKNEFLEAREAFNQFLDRPLAVPVEGVGADTKRDVFEAFLYGIYAHANPEYRRRVKFWAKRPYYSDLEAQFIVIVSHFMTAIFSMAETCRKILKTGQV